MTSSSFCVVIKNHYIATYTLQLSIDDKNTTIGQIKTRIEAEHKGNPSIENQLLLYRGKVLTSNTSVHSLLDNQQNTLQSICFHLTLRGGSATAINIGLIEDPNIIKSKLHKIKKSKSLRNNMHYRQSSTSNTSSNRRSYPHLHRSQSTLYYPPPHAYGYPPLPSYMRYNSPLMPRTHSTPMHSSYISNADQIPMLVNQSSNPMIFNPYSYPMHMPFNHSSMLDNIESDDESESDTDDEDTENDSSDDRVIKEEIKEEKKEEQQNANNIDANVNANEIRNADGIQNRRGILQIIIGFLNIQIFFKIAIFMFLFGSSVFFYFLFCLLFETLHHLIRSELISFHNSMYFWNLLLFAADWYSWSIAGECTFDSTMAQ